MSDGPKPVADPFARLRAATPARIGVGRAGDALPTGALLDFQAAHSRARDAVHAALDVDALSAALAPLPCLQVRSRVPDRARYLRRPDLGRRVAPEDLAALDAARGDWDLALVIADGLSPNAVMRTAPALVHRLLQRLPNWRVAPVVIATQARVALGDEIGRQLGARMVAVLIGERPGLSVAESLGIYLTWQPRVGRVDAERNCISNIHADGMDTVEAADTLVWLLGQASAHARTGVALKLDRTAASALQSAPPPLPGR
ncbi:MAG: ethanolamine ammonia-lyase subunit EutC [Nevskiales bacterium]|nr:ethanolamine ammonia-lyase subunit EutC [Nevskiales bacterium]